MADLNIPSINKKPDKYLFKNKLTLRRKSKKRLLTESFYMLISCFLLVYLNYLIPNKSIIFINFLSNVKKLFLVMFDLFSNLYQILLVIFILISLVFAVILFLGSLYRILKVLNRKSSQIKYK